MIELNAGMLRVALLPELGASIAAFQDGDFDIFRPTPAAAIAARDGRAFSCFPLLPYSNRIRHARFAFGGQSYALRRDAEDPRHALHGTARFHPWRVVEHEASRARCELNFAANDEWPFPYRAWQLFELSEDRLVVEIGLENLHSGPAPAGLGLHPYFLRHEGVTLQFDAAYVWDKDAEDIPVRAVPEAGKFDFRSGHAISATDLIDNAYGGWDQRAVITWPAQKRQLRLQADAVFRDAVTFTPTQRGYFAVEPVTHRPDALNPNHDPHDAPMAVLAPGERLQGRVAFIISALG